jgi:hypothetical protein
MEKLGIVLPVGPGLLDLLALFVDKAKYLDS